MQDNNNQNQKPDHNAPKQGGLSWSMPSSQVATSTPQKPVVPLKQTAPSAAPVAQSSSSAKYIGMIVVGVIAGVLLAWGFAAWRAAPSGEVSSNGSTATTTNGLGVSTTTLPAAGSDASFSIMSPQAAGMSVAIAKVAVSAPTWIVIYENKDGVPGNALGAALFFPESKSGTVELLRGTTAGKSYLAVKQVDNGDRKFSLKGDQYLSENGEVRWVTFETR